MEEHREVKVPTLLSSRWSIAYIGILGFACVYAMRVNMSVAIVCMVKDDDITPSNNTTVAMVTADPDDECGSLEDTDKGYEGEFAWDKSIEGIILSSFFYGYIVTQVPGGILAGRYGGKVVLGWGMFITAIACLLIPVGARIHYSCVIILRIIMGMATGVSFPAMSAIWGQWAPSAERSRLVTFTYAGTSMGTIITLAMSGVLCATSVGWPLIFYILGGVTVLWCMGWYLIGYSSPSNHPRISEVERNYILKTNTASKTYGEKNVSVPWLAIFSSPAVWGICIAHVCNNWGNYTILTSMPSFMKEVLKYDIKQNGFLSSMPYMVQFVTLIVSGQIADLMRAKCFSTATTRKIVQVTSFLGSAIFMIATGFVSCAQRYLGVVFLALATGFTTRAGYGSNHVDIAPRFAGILYGISNSCATVPGMVAPSVVSTLTPNGTREEWQKVWYICAGFYVVGAVCYALLVRGEEQDWAKLTIAESQPQVKNNESKDPELTKC